MSVRRVIVDQVLFVVEDLQARRYSERYYAAFVNDMYGNNVEAVWHSPEPVTDAPRRPGVP